MELTKYSNAFNFNIFFDVWLYSISKSHGANQRKWWWGDFQSKKNMSMFDSTCPISEKKGDSIRWQTERSGSSFSKLFGNSKQKSAVKHLARYTLDYTTVVADMRLED